MASGSDQTDTFSTRGGGGWRTPNCHWKWCEWVKGEGGRRRMLFEGRTFAVVTTGLDHGLSGGPPQQRRSRTLSSLQKELVLVALSSFSSFPLRNRRSVGVSGLCRGDFRPMQTSQ